MIHMIHNITTRNILLIIIYISGYILWFYSGFSVAGGEITWRLFFLRYKTTRRHRRVDLEFLTITHTIRRKDQLCSLTTNAQLYHQQRTSYCYSRATWQRKGMPFTEFVYVRADFRHLCYVWKMDNFSHFYEFHNKETPKKLKNCLFT